MSQERSERVSAIAQSAVRKQPGERSRYLREACSDDPSLISEVESILAVYDRTGSLSGEEAFDLRQQQQQQQQEEEEEEEEIAPASSGGGPDDVVGQKVGKFEIVERIGSGSMGIVYKAHDPLMDRFVGIKTLPPSSASAPQARKRFYREARSAGRLSHKNIITVHDLGEHNGRPYIAMEFLVGEDLKAKLQRKDRPSLEDQLHWMIETCEGLEHAHRKQIVHRDIKPGNIFITQEGHVKILDFGLARLASSGGSRSGLVVGTPSYMAPEQVRGEKADRRSDIYSCAATFYQLLTGQKPYTSESLHGLFYKILEDEPKPADQLNPLLPKELAAVLSKAMAKAPEDRFESAEKLRQALGDVAAIVKERKSRLRAEVRQALSQLEETLLEYRRVCRERGVVDPESAKDAERLLAGLGITDVEDDATIQLDTVLDYFTLVETCEVARSQQVVLGELIDKVEEAEELLERARAAEQEDALDEALRLAQQALGTAPGHQGAKELAARVDAELTRRREGEAEKRRKITAFMAEAEQLFSKGDLEGCRVRVDAVLEQEPTHSRALEFGRAALAKLKEEQDRQQAARRAEELVQKAEARLTVGDDPKACLALLDEAAAIEPAHPGLDELKEQATARLAELHALEEKRERALDLLREGASSLRAGGLKEARDFIERAQREYAELYGVAELWRELELAEQKQRERERKARKAKEMLRDLERRVAAGEEESLLGPLDEILRLDPTSQRGVELKRRIEQVVEEKHREAHEALARARKAHRAGELEEAVTLCGSVLLDFPGHEEARTLLMAAESELQARRERQRRAEKARELVSSAEALARRGELEAAVGLLDRAQGGSAEHPEVKKILARYRATLHEREAKVRREEQFKEKLQQAKALLEQGDYERSQREAEQALDLRPDDAEARRLVEEARSRARREREQQELRAKIDRLLDKARSLSDRGKEAAALKRAQAAVELDPSDEEAVALRAHLLQRIEQQELQKQIERKLRAARTALKRRRATEATEHLEHVLSLDASNPEALELQAELLRSAERTRRRRESLEELLEEAAAAERADQPKKALALGRSVLRAEPANKRAQELVRRLRALTGLGDELLEMELTDTSPTAETVVDLGTLDSGVPSWREPGRLKIAAVAAALIAVAIAAVYARRGRAPAAPAVSPVWVDISPWARITSLREKTTGREIDLPTRITPCLLHLPAGSYEIEFDNHLSPARAMVSEFVLHPGETLVVEGQLPEFDAALASLAAPLSASPVTEMIPASEETGQRLRETVSLIEKGRIREARLRLADLESSLAVDEENEGALRRRVDEVCMAMDERTAEAERFLQAGWEAASAQRYEKAREQLEGAIGVDVTREELVEKLSSLGGEAERLLLWEAVREARFALRQGNRQDMTPSLELARLVSPESEEIEHIMEERQLLEEAWRLYQQGDYDEAKSKFQDVLALDPENLHALQQVRRIEETELDPRPARSFEDLIRLARESIERREIRAALSSLEDARALIPDDPGLIHSQEQLERAARAKAREAVGLLFRRRHNEAIRDFEDCLEVLNDLPAVHLHLGWAYYVEYLKGGEKDNSLLQKAEAQLREALRLDPDLKTDPQTSSPRLLALLEAVRG